MNLVKRRVEKIENQLKASAKGENLDEQMEAFFRDNSMMAIIADYHNHGDLERVTKRMPPPLKEWFQKTIRDIESKTDDQTAMDGI